MKTRPMKQSKSIMGMRGEGDTILSWRHFFSSSALQLNLKNKAEFENIYFSLFRFKVVHQRNLKCNNVDEKVALWSINSWTFRG